VEPPSNQQEMTLAAEFRMEAASRWHHYHRN
jgi:hypothetical protein